MATIQDKLFTGGINLASPVFVQGGVNGAYVVSANQIAWGNSTFNDAPFGGTTVGLLTEIEKACKKTEISASALWGNYPETFNKDDITGPGGQIPGVTDKPEEVAP